VAPTINQDHQTMERKMSKFITPRMLGASAFVAAATFSILSLSTSARASEGLAGCSGTASSVISCCERFTSGHRPYWMVQSNVTCNKIVRCVQGRRCYANIVLVEGGDTITKVSRAKR
jgi:hypothetical protein